MSALGQSVSVEFKLGQAYLDEVENARSHRRQENWARSQFSGFLEDRGWLSPLLGYKATDLQSTVGLSHQGRGSTSLPTLICLS